MPLGFYVTRPLVPMDIDEVLAGLPHRARERFRSNPDELRARIEQRIRAYGPGEAESAVESLPPDEEEVEPAPHAPEPLLPQSSSILSWLGPYIAVALLIALVSALLLLRG